MQRTEKRWVSASVAALVATASGMLLMGMQEPPIRTVSLADGTPVTLLGVTEGAGTLVSGTPLRLLLHAVLPADQKHRAGVTTFQDPRAVGRSYWFRWKYGTSPNYSATVFDELGNESPSSIGHPWYADGNILIFSFQAYPRRGRIAGLRIYKDRKDGQGTYMPTQGDWHPFVEFPLDNPEPRVTTRWDPVRLPVTARAGEVQVTLSRLELGLSPKSIPRNPVEYPAPLAARETVGSATLSLSQRGRPAQGWHAQPESFSDATGNTWPFQMRHSEVKDATTHFLFSTPPWPGEELWRLKVRLLRSDKAAFRPEELATFKDLPLPRPGEIVPIPRGKLPPQFPVEFAALYGEGAKLPAPLSPIHGGKVEKGRFGLVLRTPGPHAEDVVSFPLSVRDERGQEVRFIDGGNGGYPHDTQELMEAMVPAGAKKVSFTFAVQRARYVELTAPRKLLKR